MPNGAQEAARAFYAGALGLENCPFRPRFMCRDPFGNRIELTQWVEAS